MDELTWESRIQAELEILPEELRECIYEHAYNQGRAKDYQAVLDLCTELSQMLSDPIRKYTKRITREIRNGD